MTYIKYSTYQAILHKYNVEILSFDYIENVLFVSYSLFVFLKVKYLQ